METYIALLRGINVSGQKLIKMEHLRSVFTEMKFKKVRTYIQSGNIIFETKTTPPQKLQERIEKQILETYEFEVATFIRTPAELETIVKNNPLKKLPPPASNQPYISFLHDKLTKDEEKLLLSYNSEVDVFAVHGSEIYSYSYKDKGKSVFSANFIEKKLKKPVTVRNWLTVQKLIGL